MQMKNETRNQNKSFKDSRLFWMAVSVVLALVLWVYYAMNFGSEITATFYGVEVTYTGQEALRDSQNLIISQEENTTVTLTLTGSRRDIARLTSDDLKAVVNLSTVTSTGYRTMPYTISYPSNVNQNGITEKKSPQTVGLTISRLSTRVYNVSGRFEGTLSDGYALDSSGMTFEPSTVTLTGPQEELDRIDRAVVVVNRDEVSASFTATANYTLVDNDGEVVYFDDVTADVDTVAVTVPINLTKQVALGVNLLYGGGAGEENVAVTVEPESILIAGDAATIEGVNTIYIATIDLSDYSSFPTTEYSITLPNDTDNLSGISTATVELTFTGLASDLFQVTNLDFTGLEPGYTATILDNMIVIRIRAAEDVLPEIAANNVRAVADLSGITTTTRVPVTVSVDGFPNAGAVGDYFMYVRVAPED